MVMLASPCVGDDDGDDDCSDKISVLWCDDGELNLGFTGHLGFTNRVFWEMGREIEEAPELQNGKAYVAQTEGKPMIKLPIGAKPKWNEK